MEFKSDACSACRVASDEASSAFGPWDTDLTHSRVQIEGKAQRCDYKSITQNTSNDIWRQSASKTHVSTSKLLFFVCVFAFWGGKKVAQCTFKDACNQSYG